MVNENLQVTLYGEQTPPATIMTTITSIVPTTYAASRTGFGAITQNAETATSLYPDFYQPDISDSRLSQMQYEISQVLSVGGNPVSVVKVKNLALHYSTENLGVDRRNGKIYVIYPGGWLLIP